MEEVNTDRTEGQRFLFVKVDGVEYGIEIGLVQEIIVMQEISPVPGAKPFCKGVINLRGTIVPVIDLRVKIGLEPCDYNEFACIVVVIVEGERIGMLVEEVNDVLSLEPSQIQDSPAEQFCADKRCISRQIAKVNGTAKQIMDMNRVFDLERKETEKVC